MMTNRNLILLLLLHVVCPSKRAAPVIHSVSRCYPVNEPVTEHHTRAAVSVDYTGDALYELLFLISVAKMMRSTC